MADSSKKMQIVFASAECAPFVKTGGLGDVAGSLPAALVRAGAEVIVMVPKYATIKDEYKAQMEHFSGQLKKYKVTISDLLAENEQLEARAKASEKGKMKDTMERAKLESELKDIQRLVDRIPPEVLAELKRQQRHTKER